MALDMTSFDAALKAHYTDDAVMNMTYSDNPLFALVSKMENFGGKNLPVPILYGNPQGRSATFSTAQTLGGSSASSIDDFVLTRVKDYAVATIDNETLEASKGNANAFMEAATTEIDGAIRSLTRSLAIAMYRDGTGWIGQVTAEPAEAATTAVTLLESNDITNFEVGQTVVIYSATSGGSARIFATGVSASLVTSVDRAAGTMVLAQAYDTNGTITANDYIFPSGDRGLKMKGLSAWLPASAPSATAFFGVDRSLDSVRLGGNRYDGSALPIEEALIEGAARAAREGSKIDHYFVNYDTYSELQKALGAKVQYVDLKATAEVGFRGIQINGPRGPINVVPDQNALSDVAFGVQLNTWKLYSLGKAVRVIDADGLQMLRQASSDGVEVRYGFYGQFGCRAPGHNIRVTL